MIHPLGLPHVMSSTNYLGVLKKKDHILLRFVVDQGCINILSTWFSIWKGQGQRRYDREFGSVQQHQAQCGSSVRQCPCTYHRELHRAASHGHSPSCVAVADRMSGCYSLPGCRKTPPQTASSCSTGSGTSFMSFQGLQLRQTTKQIRK